MTRSTPAPAAQLSELTKCRGITDNDARLKCYDQAVGAFEAAAHAGDVVVIDREQVKAVRRQSFGLNLPAFSLFSHDRSPSEIEVQVKSAYQGASGRWTFITAEDATWRQVDDQTVFKAPHPGSKVLIRNAALGSFFCKFDGQLAVRCARDQ